ncbi:MAG: hypothetical protein ACD_5C00075G0005 [uncultured bacterium]|nr:MAG: hypothetical protein ACD_5C00075G0005 [uncultured bacterium]
MEIVIDRYKCLSWNECQKMHYITRGQARDEVIELVLGAIHSDRKILKTAKSMIGPFTLTIEAHFSHGNRRDPDNLFVKPIIDALVKAGIFPDDNGKVIEALTLKAKTKMPNDKIIISIKDNHEAEIL